MEKTQTAMRAVVAAGSVWLIGGCSGTSVESAELGVCGGGMPGSMTVAGPVTEGGADRLAVVCWKDTNHTETGWLDIHMAGQDGRFEKAASHDVGRQPQVPVVADLDGDGLDDVLVDNTGGVSDAHYLSFLKGRPDGTFEDERRLPPIRADFVVNDINSDGAPDLVLPGERAALVVRDLDQGRFQRQKLPDIEGRGRSGDVVAGAEGTDRFAALVDRETRTLHVYLSGGRGGFQAVFPADQELPHSILGIADMNGDTRPDMVVARQKENPVKRSVHLLLSTEDDAWDLSQAIKSITENPRRAAFAKASDGEALHLFMSPGADPDGEDKFIDHVIVDTSGQVRVEGAIGVSHFPYGLAIARSGRGESRDLLVRDMEGARITRVPLAQFGAD